MKLSLEILQKHGACSEGVRWYQDNGCPKTVSSTVDLLLKSDNDNRLNWSNWLLSRMLSHKNKIHYAIYAAEQVIEIYEKKYPDDQRPRNAINAAKKVLKSNTKKNRDAADASSHAAYAAADASSHAAYAAADASSHAAYAAAYAAADASSHAAADAMKEKIINYGLSLIKEAADGRRQGNHRTHSNSD
jgi:hypothetical protein